MAALPGAALAGTVLADAALAGGPDVPYALAAAAGMLAAFNPCGFVLLPAYLTLLVADAGGSRAFAVGRALAMTGAMTAGFVGVFGLFGLVVTPLALSVEQYLPWATVLIGLTLIGLGGWLLSGRELRVSGPKLRTGAPTRSLASMGLYGASYAVASLSCTVGPFLALTTSAFHTSSLLGALGAFVAYGLGMGLVVGVLAVAVALAQDTLVARMKRALRHVTRASGVLLLLAGAYVTYYGWYELRVFTGRSVDDPVVDAVTTVQDQIVRRLDQTGPGSAAAALAALVVLALALRARGSRRATGPGPAAPAHTVPGQAEPSRGEPARPGG